MLDHDTQIEVPLPIMRPTQVSKVLLLLLPLLEIAGFIVVGGWIGVIPTLLLIILTTMLGFAVLRVKGFKNLMEMQRNMAAGRLPQTEMMGHSLLMFGALLLVMPGFITDSFGLLLLTPSVRSAITKWLISKGMTPPPPKRGVIEGEWHRDDE